MPKSLFVDPSVVRAPSKVSFNEIPVNQYNKTVEEELESGCVHHGAERNCQIACENFSGSFLFHKHLPILCLNLQISVSGNLA